MERDVRAGLRLQFRGFELDLDTRELYRRGRRVKLHGQPAELLAILATHPGAMVTRESLQQALWPKDTFVDFEHSLNSAMNRLRQALGDDSEEPRFVETVPRMGYRFIAPVSPPNGSYAEREAPPGNWPVTARYWRGLPQPAAPAAAQAGDLTQPSLNRIGVPLQTQVRLAVLPFTNISDDSHDHLAQGLSAQITVQLGRMYKNLGVVGPASSQRFTNGESISRIATELRADYLLTGKFWRVPPRLRIFTQLIRSADQTCVWTESYTRHDSDLLAVLDLITADISRGLRQALPAPKTVGDYFCTSPANYEKYLEARFFSYKFNQAAFARAMGLYEQVLAGDPAYGPAHAALAHMLAGAMMMGGPPPPVLYELIESHAIRALDLLDESAEAHSALGFVRAAQANWRAGEDEFLKALAINPSFSFAQVGYSQMLSALGRQEDALAGAKRACDLDPLCPVVHATLGLAQYHAGELADGVLSQKRSLELDPSFLPGHSGLSFIYEAMGRAEMAVEAARAAVRFAPGTALAECGLARSLAVAGHTEEASRLLEHVLRQRETNCIPATWIALAFAALGEAEAAWDWLERSFVELDPWRAFLAVDLRFKFFAADPRFVRLLGKLGFAT